MKCVYSMCNNLGVCTEEKVKVGSKYYCKECYDEKQGKDEIRRKLLQMLKTETVKNVNTVIKDLVHRKNIPYQYILFTLDKIQNKNLALNYARGLIYYLNNIDIKREYEDMILNDKFNKMIKEEENKEEEFEIQMFNTISFYENQSQTDLI